MDKEELSNYRSISNLSIISKIIEHVVKSHLMDHLTSNSLLNSHQSVYCKHHSTETALLYLHDHLVSAIRTHKVHVGFRVHVKIASRIVSYLAASVSNVKSTSPPGTHPPAVSPMLCPWSTTLRHVHHSSQYPHFHLFSKPSPLRR